MAELNTVMNLRIPTTLREDFIKLCDDQGVGVSEAMRRLMTEAVKHKIPLSALKGAGPEMGESPSEEEMVAHLYEAWSAPNRKELFFIVHTLAKTHAVSDRFIYHCFGKMVLGGAKL